MRFIVDECTGPAVARWLRGEGYEVFSVYDESRGLTDREILKKAAAEEWIVITNDNDFGELVHREQLPHHGVVLLRLKDERATKKAAAIRRLLASHADQLPDQFVVVTEAQIRFSSP